MPKFPVVKPKEIIKVLKRLGFIVDHVSGSHYVMYHRTKMFRAVVPFHNKPLKRKTLKSILKDAEISPDDLRKLL